MSATQAGAGTGTGTRTGLRLREWRDEDVPALIEVYRDPVLRQWTRQGVTDEAEAARWLETQREGRAAGERYSFAVVEPVADDRAGERLVANVVLKLGPGAYRHADVGYWTAAHARGRGVAPHAVDLLTDWAFETFADDGLTRLDLLHQVDNPASCRVAEKAGYVLERVIPAHPPFPLDGHLHTRAAAPR
ncbi:GNAT family N-acetyltransferase [Kitasatospora sp. NPDC004240]